MRRQMVHCDAHKRKMVCRLRLAARYSADKSLPMWEDTPIAATLDGVLRGLIRTGYPVTKGLKIADIDPRIEQKKNCNTISDKARSIAGGVVEAMLWLAKQRGLTLS